MPIVSQKRQVTLPLEQCAIAGIQPGDEYESFVSRKGVISIVKKTPGASGGLLMGLQVNQHVSDEESLESAITERDKKIADLLAMPGITDIDF